ncbi:MAG: hypothetical protein WA747_10325 [Steroidobacteraceae bacterium]
MLKSAIRLLGFAALLLTLAGCHPFRNMAFSCHKRQPYMGQTSAPPLIVPAGLDAPDTTNALHLPTLNEPAPPLRKGKEPCLDEPPPYKVSKPARAPQA